MTAQYAARLSLHIASGASIGVLYFGSLWWNTHQSQRGGRLPTLILSMAVRFALLGGILAAVSFEGAMPLLALAFGVLVARAAVLRRARMAAS